MNKQWTIIEQYASVLKNTQLKELFIEDVDRAEYFTVTLSHAYVDYSRQRINRQLRQELCTFAREIGLRDAFNGMMHGNIMNSTEQRSVLHTALRAPKEKQIKVNGNDIIPEIHAVLERIRAFSASIRSGEIKGYTGKSFTDIVNIGIGGSDLGPNMVCNALKFYSRRDLRMHFVSNVDPTHLIETLHQCSPDTTLFIISSKTFTTEETMTNAHAAKQWFLDNGGASWELHACAVSANLEKTSAFGIPHERVFGFWDWVGGRYSVWSAIGISIAISLGYDHFESFLAGAHSMDMHMAESVEEDNIPIMLGLIDVMNAMCFDIRSHAIIPYDEYLRMFPAFLQQMIMESNGKSVSKDGHELAHHTSPIIWGQPGTDAQHSFFQLLHQGTEQVNTEFIVCACPLNPIDDMHERLLANCAAQSAALMHGKTKQEVIQELSQTSNVDQQHSLIPHKIFPGNRPSTTIMLKELHPFSLGWLIALYEHRTFVQGYVWDICSYDQWGVELGKVLAKQLLPAVKDSTLLSGIEDSSTQHFLSTMHAFRS
ncbi:MAG: glucose-6-phosphate isomerase [Bacteroidetes bacterium]|nr:glucose-6-phosphate isomerase [Bacteroidota bacterium]